MIMDPFFIWTLLQPALREISPHKHILLAKPARSFAKFEQKKAFISFSRELLICPSQLAYTTSLIKVYTY